jgi:hypothetical protein
VPLVVVGCALGGAGQHRQNRPGAIQRLNLRFLIHAQHHGTLGRVEIQAADVIDLLDELRVSGELELLLTVRLQAERLPGPPHRILRDAQMRGQRPGGPVRRVLRRALQRGDHDPLDLLIGDRPGPSRPRLVQQALKPPLGEPVAPLRDCRARDPELLGDLTIRSAVRRGQHDPRPQRQRLRGLAPARPRLQTRAFLIRQLDNNSSRSGHDPHLP